jgi:group I intron endonuclease
MEKEIVFIYIVTCLTTKKSYVGKTTESINRRWRRHVVNKNNYCRLLSEAINLYGEDDFNIYTLKSTSINMLDYYENKYINEYNTLHPNGYNLQSGGSVGFVHNSDTLLRMSKSQKGRIINDTTKEKLSVSNQLKQHSEESKEKMKINHVSKRNTNSTLTDALDKLGLTELPKFLQFHKNEKIEVNIPNQKRKSFGDKNISLIEKIRSAIEYKNSVYNNKITISKFKILNDEDKNKLKDSLKKLQLENLPLYIYFNIVNNTERITLRIPKKKEKSFSKKNMTLEEKIRLAIEYKNLQS